jgi:hypothetical protein
MVRILSALYRSNAGFHASDWIKAKVWLQNICGWREETIGHRVSRLRNPRRVDGTSRTTRAISLGAADGPWSIAEPIDTSLASGGDEPKTPATVPPSMPNRLRFTVLQERGS